MLLEAMHLIYTKGLKFQNYDSFERVRINWNRSLILMFKLIQPINIGELFDFTRVSSANGKQIEETIGCKVEGIRYRPISVGLFDNLKFKSLKVAKIKAWLSLYGKTNSNLEEEVFRDEQEIGGNNKTGNYSIMMCLDKNIPQLRPMCGRQIKIYHAGIQKLCTNCFREHKKQHCQKSPRSTMLRI